MKRNKKKNIEVALERKKNGTWYYYHVHCLSSRKEKETKLLIIPYLLDWVASNPEITGCVHHHSG